MSDREQQGSLKDTVLSAVIDFFTENPEAGYNELSKYIKSKEIDYYDLDHALTLLAGSFVSFIYGGMFMKSEKNSSEIDQEQLAVGISVEKEHTDNEIIARRIALDHLVEIPDYYKRLSAMEKEAKK
jgi:hypothetical protein